jgi:tetratricopeptide (TPR) repeat protein
MAQAQTYATQYQDSYTNAQLAAPSSVLLPPSSSKVGKALGTNPIEQVAATQQNAALTSLYQKVQLAYTNAVSSYQKVADLQPQNSSAWLQLGQAAQTSGDGKTAIKAYKRYLKLNPASPSSAQIRQLIKSLGG